MTYSRPGGRAASWCAARRRRWTRQPARTASRRGRSSASTPARLSAGAWTTKPEATTNLHAEGGTDNECQDHRHRREPSPPIIPPQAPARSRARDAARRGAHGLGRPGRRPPVQRRPRSRARPAGVTDLRQVIAEADGLLLATPQDNGSVPGQLKNAIDGASRPPRGGVLQGKPAAVISASPTPHGAAWAQAGLRKILKIAGVGICDSGLAVPRIPGQFTPGGLLAGPAMNRGLTQVIAGLLARAAAPAARQAA